MASIRDIDNKLMALEEQIAALKVNMEHMELLRDLHAEYDTTAQQAANLTPHDRVFLARHTKRPKVDDYIDALFYVFGSFYLFLILF